MTAKLQRWVDLVAALLARHAPVTLEALRDDVPAYARSRSKAALRRMFERDKDELRALGIPIESHPLDELTGYRLAPKEFYLPYLATVTDGRRRAPKRVDRDGYRSLTELAFEPDEVEALRAAYARLQQLGQAELLADAERAVRKLAIDIPELERRERPRAPGAGNGGSAFAPLMDALSHRRKVRFDYHAIGGDTRGVRTVRPYGLFFLSSHWYLAAVEEESPAGPVKNFRLSRISDVRPVGTSLAAAQYEVPKSFSLAAHARDRRPWELGDSAALEVVVAFTPKDGAATAAARLGRPVPGHPGRRRFAVRRIDAFVRWLLSYAGQARPLGPAEVVTAWEDERRAVAALYAGGRDG